MLQWLAKYGVSTGCGLMVIGGCVIPLLGLATVVFFGILHSLFG